MQAARRLTAWQEVETYIEGAYRADWRLIDERGAEIPFQHIGPEALAGSEWGWNKRRLVLRQDLAAGALRVLRQDITTPRAAIASAVSASGATLGSAAGAGIDPALRAPGSCSWKGREVTSPLLHAHRGRQRQFLEPRHRPLRRGRRDAALGDPDHHRPRTAHGERARVRARSARARLAAEWRVYAGARVAELLLRCALA